MTAKLFAAQSPEVGATDMNEVGRVQRAWGLKITAGEGHELFDRLACLGLVTSLLPDHKGEIARVCRRLRRESCNFPDDGFETSLRDRAVELCKEVTRKNLTPIERWVDNKKTKGVNIDRSEFLKRQPRALRPLPVVARDAGTVSYDLSALDSKCSSVLVVKRQDAPFIERLGLDLLELKTGRGTIKHSLWYKHVFIGRSGTQTTLRPLESLIPQFAIVAGKNRDDFSQEELDAKAERKTAKAGRNPLSLEGWMHSGYGGVTNDEFISAPAPSIIGVVKDGEKRPAGKWRSGKGVGSRDTEYQGNDAGFVASVQQGAYERGSTLHEDDDRRKGRLEVDVLKVNLTTKETDGETDGVEDEGKEEESI